MSKLNQANEAVKSASYNGNVQYKKSPEQQLYELAVTSMYGKDNYYETNKKQI